MKKKLWYFLGMMTLMMSCVSDFDEFDNGVSSSGLKIMLDGTISQQYISRVNDGGFCDGDQIGLYGVNYTDNNTVQGTLLDDGNQVNNARYTYDEENFTWNSTGSIYYKDANTNIDLYAYYPYGSPENVDEYEFEVYADQSGEGDVDGYAASDFLWGMAANVTPSSNKVKISFSHRLSCANVYLTKGDGFAEGEFEALEKSVIVSNTKRTASINLSTGVATAVGEVQPAGISMRETEGGYRAVVVPQSLNAGIALYTITVNGITYRFKLDEAFTFNPGKQSKFTIQINKKEMTGEYEFTLADTEIVDWIADIETHGGEARQYYVVNQEQPGTLGSLIRADKKNPNKIKNLKIAGKINAADFYFMRDSMEVLQAVNLKETTIEAGWIWSAHRQNNGVNEYVTFHFDNDMPENSVDQWSMLYEKYSDFSFTSWAFGAPIAYGSNEIPPEAFCYMDDWSSDTSSPLVYFSFPENVTKIGKWAFAKTLLTGALIIPNDVIEIGENAFYSTNITSLELPNHLENIGSRAFNLCSSLSSMLSFPESLKELGEYTFAGCSSLTGSLSIPNNVKEIPTGCFRNCAFTGDLIIPEGVVKIGESAFSYSNYNGKLTLPNSLKEIGEWAFSDCNFQGELFIPKQIQIIRNYCFQNTRFASIVFAGDSELLYIGNSAFRNNRHLTETVTLPEKIITIGEAAFASCDNLPQIVIPYSVNTIGSNTFNSCYNLSSLKCKAILPPNLGESVFEGVPKDNFTLEVPEQSVVRYQTAAGWGEFKRISAHHDFSISRPLLRALNASYSKTYTLRAPADQAWSIQSKPDWITVSPSNGVGKTEVTVIVSEMPTTEETFETFYLDEWGNKYPEWCAGRAGEIVFLLDEKDYTSTMKVEQYNYNHYDGEVIVNQTATKGAGVNIVFMGDCFDAKDIATGKYLEGINEAIGYYFDIEPYKTYKEYFNVYTVIGMSPDTGMGTVNTVKEAKFGSQYALNKVQPDIDITYEYAMKAETVNESNLNRTLVVMVENTPDYGGICYMWDDGKAIAVCPMSRDAYPYDFRGIVQHEAGGHGFAKLGDEYIYHNAFIEDCNCICCRHLVGYGEFIWYKSLGWYRNLSTNGDMKSVEWSHLIYHPDYANVVDMYEGGFYHTRGIYRSEATSCMNNNIPYYSAIQRQEMVERIMLYAGETFSLEDFYAKDVRDASNNTVSRSVEPTAAQQAAARRQMPPQIMGDKPILK